MIGCEEKYEDVCKGEFGKIHTKLDALDEAIRGNGKPGIQTRLDRLEHAEETRSRLLWVITGAVVTLAAAGLWKVVFGA